MGKRGSRSHIYYIILLETLKECGGKDSCTWYLVEAGRPLDSCWRKVSGTSMFDLFHLSLEYR